MRGSARASELLRRRAPCAGTGYQRNPNTIIRPVFGRAGARAVAYRGALSEMVEILLVTDDTFEREVIRSALPVVVDFYADWCVPCRAAEPVLRQLSDTLTGRVKFTRVNVDDSSHIATSFGIHSIPTYLFLEEGRERGREVGVVGPREFRTILQKYFNFV
jgi:thioredoxin 1